MGDERRIMVLSILFVSYIITFILLHYIVRSMGWHTSILYEAFAALFLSPFVARALLGMSRGNHL